LNKKILIGIAIVVIITAVGIVGVKAMLGDDATELPFEEEAEKTLDLQEGGESSEIGESEEDEYRENNP
jgi:hypothetical protein